VAGLPAKHLAGSQRGGEVVIANLKELFPGGHGTNLVLVRRPRPRARTIPTLRERGTKDEDEDDCSRAFTAARLSQVAAAEQLEAMKDAAPIFDVARAEESHRFK